MNKIVTFLLGTALLCSCQNQNEELTPSSKLEIETNNTKALVDAFESGHSLGIFVANETSIDDLYTPFSFNVKSTYDGDKWAFESDVILNHVSAKVYAYYPYSSEKSEGSAIPIEHVSQTDYMNGTHTSGQGVINYDNYTVHLTMRHTLSLLHIKIKKTENYKAAGHLTKIAFAGGHSEGTINLENSVIAYGETKDPAFITMDYTIPPTSKDENHSLLIMPQRCSDDTRLEFTIDERIFSLPIKNITFEQGKSYQYDITLDRDLLKLNGFIIADWKTGNSNFN